MFTLRVVFQCDWALHSANRYIQDRLVLSPLLDQIVVCFCVSSCYIFYAINAVTSATAAKLSFLAPPLQTDSS